MTNTENDLAKFFPEDDYQIPTTSNYMKFKEGKNPFRVLSSAVVGYEYWRIGSDGKPEPVRSKEAFPCVPNDIQLDEKGNPTRINHFWAFIVWNYNDRRVQILQLTQKGIMKYIKSLVDNPKWGLPTGYDIVVTREGTGLDTEYSVIADPHSEIDPEIAQQAKERIINLEKLFIGEDPFSE